MRIAVALLMLPVFCLAQSRHDANWVFGYRCGLHFDTLGNTVPFFPGNVGSFEPIASFSDSMGALQFTTANILSNSFYSIVDQNGNELTNGDNINTHYSTINGLLTIPILEVGKVYILSLDNQSPKGYNLYLTELNNRGGSWIIKSKNRQITRFSRAFESLAAVRHSNGQDWWIYNAAYNNDTLNSKAKYHTWLLTKDGLSLQQEQIMGPGVTESFQPYIGEVVLSLDGTKMVRCFQSKFYDRLLVFDVNRCTGVLSLTDTISIDRDLTLYEAYSCAFSPSGRFIYATQGIDQPSLGSYTMRVLQFDLHADSIKESEYIVWNETISGYDANQMELAPNGKIYISLTEALADNKYLSVINFPDSAGVACGFELQSIYAGDSCELSLGLPNFPNYNLGPLSIYKADAGRDTVFVCANDADSIKIVYLGDSLPVTGVQYLWQGMGINGKDSSRVLVQADTFGTYYLTLTDTTIQYSCQSRVDTVVIVPNYNCPTSVANRAQKSEVRLWPNPFSGDVSINMPKQGKVHLYDLSGNQLGSYKASEGLNTIPLSQLSLANGMYIYKVWVNNNLVLTDKLVKME